MPPFAAGPKYFTRTRVAPLLVAVLGLGSALAALSSRGQHPGEATVEHEEKSAYSKIRVLKEKSVRTLGFVRDAGDLIVESRVDLDKPHELQIPYTRYMFASYLLRPEQERVLIVGLGGGSMVHFLKHYEPKLKVDVVEIDPAVVRIAEKYFNLKSGGNVTILTKDAFDYLKNAEARYDVIYMDAFLKPAAGTDDNGVPAHLKTVEFYKLIQKKLTADGLVVYNVHPHDKAQDDLKNIRDAFPQSYVFRLPQFRGFVAVGTLKQQRAGIRELRGLGGDLDARFQASFSFRDMAERLAP